MDAAQNFTTHSLEPFTQREGDSLTVMLTESMIANVGNMAPTNVPQDEDQGGSGGNAYCVIA